MKTQVLAEIPSHALKEVVGGTSGGGLDPSQKSSALVVDLIIKKGKSTGG
ncbi:hypothetical protein N473_18520 [Pseudoalteromonas luteoviolacea CPMOR-1]|uniref:Uncharacterized protein n=1 Tax=Pseudoalteromonas luteoviolacea CPMOR-1 TaxID=1365248 RepID=A0A167KDA2_9GAMM|nr:hypothetical protein [Pseudoalteromonas luteoviolacea]KZN62625.1 hypothetical protein N473_18520 [Pseudoalteromonas luteoviolacea CPMOR-1]